MTNTSEPTFVAFKSREDNENDLYRKCNYKMKQFVINFPTKLDFKIHRMWFPSSISIDHLPY